MSFVLTGNTILEWSKKLAQTTVVLMACSSLQLPANPEEKANPSATAKAVRDAVNVKALGAKGDGITDDTNAFNTALREADPIHGGPGRVFVPASPKPYMLGAPIVLHSGELLYANPGSAVIAPITPYPKPNITPLLATIRQCSSVTISGLTFDGSQQTVGVSSPLITVYSSDHVLIERVDVRNARGVAILFNGGPRGILSSGVDHCTFKNIGTYQARSGNTKKGAHSGPERQQCLAFCCGDETQPGVWNNQHNFARSNHFVGNGFDNLLIDQQSWFEASNNKFERPHSGANIYCSQTMHTEIFGNTSYGGTGSGIECVNNKDLQLTNNQPSPKKRE